MPLQNRVKPNGELVATPERGTMMGNRGGKFHRDDQTLGKRRWASTHWICCDLHWRNAHHEPMGQGYTSLFFLDEVTALAAGHRPCFYCRRKEAKKFLGNVKVREFDQHLHAEREASKNPHPPFGHLLPSQEGREKANASAFSRAPSHGRRSRQGDEGSWPQGTMFEIDNNFYALKNQRLLRWSFSGYTKSIAVTDGIVLTPPSIIAILQSGYEPRWHESAKQWD
jgi:hypothetical protein